MIIPKENCSPTISKRKEFPQPESNASKKSDIRKTPIKELCPEKEQVCPKNVLLGLINISRVHAWGLLPLETSKSMETYAQMHAEHMAKKGELELSLTNDELQIVLGSSAATEHVQSSYCAVSDVKLMYWEGVRNKRVNGLMDKFRSESLREIGIGLAVSSMDGKVYLCQLFRGS